MKSRKIQENRQIVFLHANTKEHKVSVLKHVANKFYVGKRKKRYKSGKKRTRKFEKSLRMNLCTRMYCYIKF